MDDFAKKMRAMHGLYLETEREFLEFDAIVPYDRNPDAVYSPRLYGLLQSAGSQVDTLLRIVTDETHIKPKSGDFPGRYDVLNAKGLLEAWKVATPRNMRVLHPFKMRRPDWWVAYNDSKHDLPDGLYTVNLGKVMETLGAICILHYLGLTLLLRQEPGFVLHQQPDASLAELPNFLDKFLDPSNWLDFETELRTKPEEVEAIKVRRNGEIIPHGGKPSLMATLYIADPLHLERYSSLFYHCWFCLIFWGYEKP